MVPTTTEGATAVLGYWTKHHRDAFGPLDDHLERRAASFGEGRAEQHRALCLTGSCGGPALVCPSDHSTQREHSAATTAVTSIWKGGDQALVGVGPRLTACRPGLFAASRKPELAGMVEHQRAVFLLHVLV